MLAVSKEEVGVGVGCAPRRAVWLKQKEGERVGMAEGVGGAGAVGSCDMFVADGGGGG